MILLMSCLASYLIVSDIAMVNVALPSIADAMAFSQLEQLWFVSCYALLFSALPLFAGRLADVFGHRRLFLIGLCTFAAAGFGCGFAGSSTWLLIARGVQGIGGALLAATSLSLLTSSYTDGAARRRAVAIWSATVSIGAVIGVLLGGIITSSLGWRYVFLLGAVVATGTAALAAFRRPVPLPVDRTRRLDAAGGALVTAGLALLAAGLIESSSWGWLSAGVLGLLAGGVTCLAAFLRWESRCIDPLMPVALFFHRRRAAAMLATAVIGFDLYFLYFAVSVYLQRAQGHGPLAAGLMTLPAAGAVVAGSLLSPLLNRRFRVQTQVAAALALVVAGFVLLSRLQLDGSYWTTLALPLAVIGFGFGTSFVPATLLVTGELPGGRHGVAAGAVNTSRQVGRAVGLAALSGLVTAGLHPLSPARLAAGESRAFLICAAVSLVGLLAVLGLWLRRDGAVPAAAPTPVAEVVG